MNTIEVWAFGSEVKMASGKIDGKITSVTITESTVEYRIAFWDLDKHHQVEWLKDIEFEICEGANMQKISFNHANNGQNDKTN